MNIKEDTEKQDKKIDSKHLIKDIMVLEPAAALKFVAKQFDDSDPKTFLLKNLLPFTVYAVKNGFVKAKDIGKSIKDFSKKNKTDTTEIDFKTVDIDEDTMKKIYILDNDTIKKLEDFIKEYEVEMKDVQKDVEEAAKTLDKDIKTAGVKLEKDQLADNALVVAGVIDNEDNKDLKGKEIQAKVDDAISKKTTIRKNALKTIKQKSSASKKNDALRAKINRAVKKGIASKFKDAIKISFLSSKNFKKAISTYLKVGLKAENIPEDDRVICIAVKCKRKNLKKVLGEAKVKTTIVDITNGSKSKLVQKIVDYINDAIKKSLGNKKTNKFYAYRKQSKSKNGVDTIFVFISINNTQLQEAINEENIISNATVSNTLNVFSKETGISMRDIFKLFAKNSKSTASINMASNKINLKIKDFFETYDNDPNKALEELKRFNNPKQCDVLAEIICKIKPDATEQFEKAGIEINGTIDGLVDNDIAQATTEEVNSIEKRIPDAVENKKEVAELADNEETKQQTQGFLGKLGNALRTFGQAVAVAKIAKFALNNTKPFIDACGGMAIKFKENEDAVAQITVLVNNSNDADQKYSDTRFGVYFSADDLKWHATNLDDRKMQINSEEDLVKRVLDTNTGKEFKKEFLSRLEKVLDGKNGNSLKYFINNYKRLGIKVSDKATEKLLNKMKNITSNFDEVKKQFA